MKSSFDRLVLASHNQGKLREFGHYLNPLGIKLVSSKELQLPVPEEPFATFIENSLHKARQVSQLSGLPSLADDSGLCVIALNGSPGINSSHYASDLEEERSDERNNGKLLQILGDGKNRFAYFYCVMVLLRYPDDPAPCIGVGVWHGEILTKPIGEGGFGYDPIFWDSYFNKSAAQLSLEEKQERSHRGQALRSLMAQIK